MYVCTLKAGLSHLGMLNRYQQSIYLYMSSTKLYLLPRIDSTENNFMCTLSNYVGRYIVEK